MFSGCEWIERANDRPIGRLEFRQVTMEIGTGWSARTLSIRTLRETDGVTSRTVCCLMRPRALHNINYVVTEKKGLLNPFSIQIYFPYLVGTLLNLPSQRRREGLLGSDFSYDDLRTWLYVESHTHDIVEVSDSIVRIRCTCIEGSHLIRHGTAPFDVWLDRTRAFVSRIDYFLPDKSKIARTYSAEEVTLVDGFAIAGKMTMVDRIKNHQTTIRLDRAWYDRQIDEDVFDPSFRKHTYDFLVTL